MTLLLTIPSNLAAASERSFTLMSGYESAGGNFPRHSTSFIPFLLYKLPALYITIFNRFPFAAASMAVTTTIMDR